MEKYFAINKEGCSIRCKLYCDKISDIRKAVLYTHGFAGNKDTASAKKFAERVLTKYKGIAILTFDLPCHGDDVRKKMSLQDCMTYLAIIIRYIREELHAEEIYSYAMSFGAYLNLRYLAEFGDPFVRIALRSPAINMYESLTSRIMRDGEFDAIMKGKTVPVGFDNKIGVGRQFLEELESNDIRKISYLDYADDILIIHGMLDEVIPISVSKAFADDNVIEFLPVEHADHRFQNPACMETAIKAILQFFKFT
ncbi:MAG: hypothetical protein IJR62_04160 [Lachnospiraceae bacterium]|nr:hypothetical protein [Lachnospiraceae bacterium]